MLIKKKVLDLIRILEVPKVEANKEQAMSNFRVGFTFSINR